MSHHSALKYALRSVTTCIAASPGGSTVCRRLSPHGPIRGGGATCPGSPALWSPRSSFPSVSLAIRPMATDDVTSILAAGYLGVLYISLACPRPEYMKALNCLPSMTQQPVRIIGAGIGGLTLGRCLAKRGVPVILFERMASTPRHSYGVTLHASSYRPLLDVLGLDEWTFRRRIAVDGPRGGSGNIEPTSLVCPASVEPTSFRAHRERLERLLREGLDVQWEHALDRVEEDPSSSSTDVLLCLQNGQKLPSACVFGVDGPHSNTRKSLSSDTPLQVLPFVAFNGKRRVKNELFNRVYAPAMGASNVIELKRDDTVLNISINEHQGDVVSISWIFSRPAKGSSDPLHKPNRHVSGATDIPEEFYQEVTALEDLPQPFKEVFDAQKLKMERVLHWLMRSVLVSRGELDVFAKKGVFFMGDSVHAEPILGGEGANNAITDGLELAECFSSRGVEAIPSWYDARYPSWEAGISRSETAIAEMHGSHKSAL
jgi:2-polyprenyl-6-methoxyphenol hydroxylase-like FAD-dependent oxidoreductase